VPSVPAEMRSFREIFPAVKVLIAMIHLPPLPGSRDYDEAAGMAKIVESARRDLRILQEAGVDGVLFCNENDRPYVLEAGMETVAAMAAVVGELRADVRVPFGVDILWDPMAAVAVAAATGAHFAREIFTGTFDSDMGLWSPRVGRVARYQRAIGARGVRLFFNIQGEFASPIGRRSLVDVARSVAQSSLPSAICVSGPITGEPPQVADITAVKSALPDLPVLVNTGVNHANVRAMLAVADGAIVGSALKRDGVTWNELDPARVASLVEQVAAIRSEIVTGSKEGVRS
jgi:membrane complex biogenesis BtpA family protein